jgi:uncharacterized lipoprotein
MHTMMRVLGVSVITLAMTGCAATSRLVHRHDNDYLKASKSDAALKLPASASSQNIKSAYPIPKGAAPEAVAPSLVPPGSQIHQIRKNLNAKKTTTAALPLSMSTKVAWVKVGASLKRGGYQVLDQDRAMGAYFVLDPQETGGKVTKTTPILRVNVTGNTEASNVTVASHGNTAINAAISQRVLTSISSHMG